MSMHAGAAKQVVRELWDAVASGRPEELRATVTTNVAAEAPWHVSTPIDLVAGEALFDQLLLPMTAALRPTHVDWHVLIAGSSFDGATYVTGTGYLHGTSTSRWLGIAPTGQAAALRFGVLHRVVDGRVAATWLLLDLLDLAHRSGAPNLPGRYDHTLVPGPMGPEGLGVDVSEDAGDAASSLQLVEDMIFRGLSQFDANDLASMGMERFWHPAMRWYGPGAIGSTHGIAGFEDLHQRPFVSAWPDRKGGNHIARFAEGMFVASGGWPSLHGTHTGEAYLGIPATGRPVAMRVMDWWRREDGLLTENWVMIDLPDAFAQLGRPLFVDGELVASEVQHV